MQKYIDAHCHIGNGTTDNTVAAFFCNSVDETDWINILRTARRNSAVVPALGIHPWRVGPLSPEWDGRLIEHLAQNPHCMVGEIGLDKLHPNYDVQIDVFTKCINIAADMHRAVHIHCVRAWGDMVDILTGLSILPPVIVFHAFGASVEIMHQLLKLNTRVYFSYGSNICDAKRKGVINSVRHAQPDNILIESDGAMSTSGNTLRRVAGQIAAIKNMPIESVINTIYNNAQRVIHNG